MYQISLTIGHNVGVIEALTIDGICDAVTDALGVEGFTAVPCRGMWRGMAEKSTRIEIIVDEHNDVTTICNAVPNLAAQLNQEAIMVDVRESSTMFITPTIVAA